MLREAYSVAHVAVCLAGNVAPDDPRFDRGYFTDCFAMLDLVQSGAPPADLRAFVGGSFDGWRDWFALTLAYMPPYLAYGRALEASQGQADYET